MPKNSEEVIKNVFNMFKLRWVWSIPVILFAITIFLSYTAETLNTQKAQDLFKERQNQFISDLSFQLEKYDQLLRGGSALFSASDEVTQEEWHTYVSRLKINKNFPEISEFSYAEISETQDMQEDTLLHEDELLDFDITFNTEDNFNIAARYIEPSSQMGKYAAGFDVWDNQSIKEAMKLASLTQEAVISKKIDNIYESELENQHSNIVMVLPEYKTYGSSIDGILDTMDLRGFLYLILKADEIFGNIFSLKNYGLCAEFFDVSPAGQKTLLFANNECISDKNWKYDFLNNSQNVTLFNSNWQVIFSTTSKFSKNINTKLPFLIFLLGSALSFFCFLALWRLANAKHKAEGVALEKVRLLSESEKRLSAAIEGGALGLWDWEVSTGKVIYSKGWASMIGYDVEELAPKISTWKHLVHPNDIEFAEKEVVDYIEGRSPVFQVEFRMRHKKSGWVWILSRGKITERDEEGKPTRLLGTHTDITKLKNAEKKFIESQKMEAIGQLSGGIAHDFNNLLTITFGNITLLERLLSKEEVDVKACHKKVDIIKQTAERGASLVKRLMVFSRQKEMDLQIVDLNKLIENLEPLLKRSVTEIIDLNISLKDGAWSAFIDSGQFEQALINLCINARDAMPEGGILSIETKNVSIDEDHVLSVSDLKPGEFVMISISDTGHGIDKSIQEKIFDPFFTTKDIGKGTGLGLSMVYGLVQDSGGYINVYSEKGVGTTFRIYLPRTEEIPESNKQSAYEKELTDSSYMGTETILVVEDEPEIRELVRQNLVSYGYNILTAQNGHEALDIINSAEQKIDLLFSDIAMPGQMSGIKLAQEILKNKYMKILLTTGFTKENIPNRNLYNDEYDLISKPYSNDELMQKIREILDRTEFRQYFPDEKAAS